MRWVLLLLLLLLLAAPGTAAAAEAVPGRVVVGFARGVDAGERAGVRADADASLLGTVTSPREQVLRIDGDPEEVAADLERRPEVAYAEPDYVVRAQWSPNDGLLGTQWWLAQTGIPRAWDGARGAGALVGVVDTGVSFAHPDLGRFDSRGYDFANGDADPTDDHGHGTSVTGVIAATADNGVGIAGTAPEATVIVAKALAADGSGPTSSVADAADHLADRGARVVNLSLGGAARAHVLTAAITNHPETLFVVAAGNGNTDNDAGGGTWPCNEPAANVICVGASTPSEGRAGFSNWGAASVDLMAPGASISTTRLDGEYGSFNGTSFSAPVVAGAAALLFGHRPDATVADVRFALLSSTDAAAAYSGITVTGGRLNVERALTSLAPNAVPGVAPAPAPPAPTAPAPAPAALVTPRATPKPRPTASRNPSPCTVPKLRRLTSSQARRRLQAAGCTIGTVRRRYSTAVRKGRVVTSTPGPGRSARAVIGVLVSRGPRA